MEPTPPPPSATLPTSKEQPTWLYPDADPIALSARAFVCDPYGGIPRREDYDLYNTTQRPPPRTHDNDMQATFRTFRDVVLSTQSWGVQWTDATDTSVKRWVRRALKDADVEDTPSSASWVPPPLRTASSGDPSNANWTREHRETPTSAPPIKHPPTLPQTHSPAGQRRQHRHLAWDDSS
ncbi:hypothetical protein JKF63_03580 [Porcisia hertigi]|uniref:Uncharacterized protein n=1 Tax=Porcisia hertigi TaxID=2761500 RepID=A0A836ILL2_9TRYP|nr:hypothetical protein JKF63_03580 [Porcisia hertigi]